MLDLYKHNKSGGIYARLAEANLESDGTQMTVYCTFPTSQEQEEIKTFVRPTAEFDEILETGPRFEKLNKQELNELAMSLMTPSGSSCSSCEDNNCDSCSCN